MKEIAEGLKAALDGASNVVVTYTDLSRVVSEWAGSRDKTLELHAQLLFDALGDRTIMFPTFNYDFARTLRYNPETSPAQVGALNEYMRQHHSVMRPPGALFTFVCVRFKAPYWPPRQIAGDVFGPGSVFRWLINEKAAVVAYGARLRYASALHVVERDRNVPYRFFKDFKGEIEGYGPYTARYHVRPQIPGGVEYDWNKVDALLEPVFRTSPTCDTIRVGSAHEVYATLAAALSEDEHVFLKHPPTELYEKYGKPLTQKAIEGES